MDRLVFDDSLKTGIEVVDEQHKKLIEVVNNFLDKLLNSDTKAISSEVEKLFDFMAEYSVFHFQTEEKIMEENSCPTLDLHRSQHQFFIMEANKLKFDLRTKGLTPELLSKVQYLLLDWVKDHIMDMDKKICDKKDKVS
ncbi:MAG: hemerythrin family protein [Brevinematia bacterium]